jgi:hypothetical protein
VFVAICWTASPSRRAGTRIVERREQFFCLRIDDPLLRLERGPALVELCRVLAAQQDVLPLLHLELEIDEDVRGHPLVRDMHAHEVVVFVDRAVHRIEAVHRAREHQEQRSGESERKLECEFHER